MPALVTLLQQRARAFIAQAPVHWALVLLMAGIIPLLTLHTAKPGEWFPFSHFPMYKGFESHTYYVYVKDAADQIVPISSTFGRSISDLKKTYDRKLDGQKDRSQTKGKKRDLPPELKAAAAQEALRWLLSIVPADKQSLVKTKRTLRLHEVRIVFDQGQIQKNDVSLGEIAVP